VGRTEIGGRGIGSKGRRDDVSRNMVNNIIRGKKGGEGTEEGGGNGKKNKVRLVVWGNRRIETKKEQEPGKGKQMKGNMKI